MRGWIAGSLTALAVLMLMAAPAVAEQDTPSSTNLNLDLKIGKGGFRLGGQLFGLGGVWGAWVNGERRADGGFTVDGRLQQPDRAFNFKINADIENWLRDLWPGTPGGTTPAPRIELPRGFEQL
jgi:hypothetical protein